MLDAQVMLIGVRPGSAASLDEVRHVLASMDSSTTVFLQLPAPDAKSQPGDTKSERHQVNPIPLHDSNRKACLCCDEMLIGGSALLMKPSYWLDGIIGEGVFQKCDAQLHRYRTMVTPGMQASLWQWATHPLRLLAACQQRFCALLLAVSAGSSLDTHLAAVAEQAEAAGMTVICGGMPAEALRENTAACFGLKVTCKFVTTALSMLTD